ncbi:hypothetical protein LSG25_02680 [Paralcaligenes sp. KSB-10]|uniref:hypothetical protein n=1 Tax=Paralcaligenes sp. KSB-10 TaxID=2901142 RepID=UPI001E5EC22A|nr:hypothetical protein [Paralcaligenes sp. KSB-10]UHL64828.1 hypothetical protein LSG25_02680 [Paralcaligenes sp. KSB-10]
MKKNDTALGRKNTPFPTKRANPGTGEEFVGKPALNPDVKTKTKKEKALDEALEESFPASDPVSISTKKATKSSS